eukprot:1495322-Pyramimonas_sp.AAC.1
MVGGGVSMAEGGASTNGGRRSMVEGGESTVCYEGVVTATKPDGLEIELDRQVRLVLTHIRVGYLRSLRAGALVR